MIKSIREFRMCLKEDYAANGYKGLSQYFNVIRKYIHALRLAELASNVGGAFILAREIAFKQTKCKNGHYDWAKLF